jgi:arylsulfatase
VERPCILVIVTDQQRYRASWPVDVRLPAFDRLAETGLSFTRAYTPSALCTPARAAMFTGHHASTVGMDDNINFPWQGSMSPAIPTLGTHLRTLGYRASYLGKWHLTRNKELGADGLTPFGFSDWQGPDRHGRPREGTKTDPALADSAAAWLSEHGDAAEPWCLVVSFVNPHDIMFSPRVDRPTSDPHSAPYPVSFADDLTGKPSIQRRFRNISQVVAGVVKRGPSRRWQEVLDAYVDYHRAVDVCVKRVLDQLDDSGLSRRTIVLYTSDHGELAGAHGLRGKGPVVYEENSRVPFIARCPGVIAEGARTDALYSGVDLTPTVLGLAGGERAEALTRSMAGTDQSAVVFGRAERARSQLLFHYTARATLGLPWSRARGFVVGRFDGRHKLARYYSRSTDPFDADTEVEDELYDLRTDPHELHNLATPGARKVASVHGRVAEHAARTEALARGERAFDGPPAA